MSYKQVSFSRATDLSLPEYYNDDGDDHGVIVVMTATVVMTTMTVMMMMMTSGASTCFIAKLTVNVPGDLLQSQYTS